MKGHTSHKKNILTKVLFIVFYVIHPIVQTNTEEKELHFNLDISFKSGQNLTLECHIEQFDTMSKAAIWKKDWILSLCFPSAKCIPSTSADKRYEYRSDNNGIQLIITNVSSADIGKYTCVDPDNNIVQKFTLFQDTIAKYTRNYNAIKSIENDLNINRESNNNADVQEGHTEKESITRTYSNDNIKKDKEQRTLGTIILSIFVFVVLFVTTAGIVVHCIRDRSRQKGIYDHLHRTELAQDEKCKGIQFMPYPSEKSLPNISCWKDDEKAVFCRTKATDYIYKLGLEKRVIIVTGLPRSGKSANVHHVALRLEKEGYRIVCVSCITEISNEIKKKGHGEKQVFVCDDVFEKAFASQATVEEFKRATEPLKGDPNVLLLCTSRSHIIKKIQKASMSNITSIVDVINISQYDLSVNERVKIFKRHASANNRDDLLENNIMQKIKHSTCPVGCLTLLCTLDFEQKGADEFISEYFKTPRRHIQSDKNLSGELLHHCVYNKDNETSRYLIKHGVDLNFCDKVGKSPLYHSLCYEENQISKLLIEAGADVNKCDISGISPLYLSVSGKDFKMSDLIIKHDANVNKCNKEGKSSLYIAVGNNDYPLARLLIQKAAEVNQNDNTGKTPLYLSVKNDNLEISELLITNNANLNTFDTDGKSPLYVSVFNDNLQMSKLLLENKADVSKCDKYGKSPYKISLDNGNVEISKLLIKHGATFEAS